MNIQNEVHDSAAQGVKSLKIAIAIPTYNRLEKLKFALAMVQKQQITTPGVELYCVISNSCSTDGTTEFLDGLKSDTVQYITWNTPEYVDGAIKYVGIENWERCFNSVPQEVDWVWIMGDDDYLTGPAVIEGLAQLLLQQATPTTTLVHMCQARRSCKTGSIIKGTLFDLCNRTGFHEMLGWMSSIVIRTQRLHQAIHSELWRTSISAYRHSAAFLEACHADDALFIDTDWVEPQDLQQTPESIARWAKENMGEKYFYVVDDLVKLYDKNILVKKCNPIFFRYLTYSLWDRYAAYLIGDAVNRGGVSEATTQHWRRVEKIADMLANPVDQKMFRNWISSLLMEVNRLTQAQNEVANAKKRLVALHNSQSSNTYPFTNLNTSGTLFPV